MNPISADEAAPAAIAPGMPERERLRPRNGYCRVKVNGTGSSFDVQKGELLLLAAIAQGIDYPHNCRVGTCGSCKTRLVGGRISPMVDFALSPLSNDELKSGYILACQAKVRTDLDIEIELGRRPQIPSRTVSSRIVRWRNLPGEVIDLRLRLDEPLRFNAGQYCTIAHSGSFVRRSYSFYDRPPAAESAGAIEVGFLVKRLPGGRFSEWLFERDRSQEKIWLEGPFGMMGVADIERDAVCVAGGTGLAPILSIVADRLARSTQARFTIVFGVRTANDLFAGELLERVVALDPRRVRLVTVLSHEPGTSGWAGARGPVTAALTPDLGVDFSEANAFVCGSLPMVEAVERKLAALGVALRRIHADKFLPTG